MCVCVCVCVCVLGGGGEQAGTRVSSSYKPCKAGVLLLNHSASFCTPAREREAGCRALRGNVLPTTFGPRLAVRYRGIWGGDCLRVPRNCAVVRGIAKLMSLRCAWGLRCTLSQPRPRTDLKSEEIQGMFASNSISCLHESLSHKVLPWYDQCLHVGKLLPAQVVMAPHSQCTHLK